MLRKVLLWAGGIVGMLLLAAILFAWLGLDWFVKRQIETGFRRSGEINVEIGGLDIGLLRSRLRLENVQVFTESNFGGVKVLDLPELHLEYDRSALSQQRFHGRLLRIHIKELTLIDGMNSATNNMTMLEEFTQSAADWTNAPAGGSQRMGGRMEFAGLDRLELTLGQVRFVDLRDASADRVALLSIKNRVLTNITTLQDFLPLLVDLSVRSTLGAQPVKRPVKPSK
jgi:hypothetical protein